MIHTKPSSSSLNSNPIVFFHGSKNSAFCYENFQAYFSENNIETLAISFRGYGNSKLNDSGKSFSVSDSIEDLNLLFAECPLLQGKKPYIVAHSLGGYVIQSWLLSQLEKGTPLSQFSSGICLLCSSPPSGNSKLVTRTLFRLGPFASWAITKAFITEDLTTDVQLCRKVFFTDLDKDEAIAKYMPKFTQNIKLNTRSIVPLTDEKVPNADELKDVPFLTVGAKQDVIVDEPAVKETQSFWGGELALFDDAPHELMLYHNWRGVCEKLNDWISQSSNAQL